MRKISAKYSLTFAKIDKISPEFSHNFGLKFRLAKFLLNIQACFRRPLPNIFSILLKMLLRLLKFIRHFPEIFVKFFQNDLTIFSKPFSYIFYNVRFIYKICFLVLEPASNFFRNILFF